MNKLTLTCAALTMTISLAAQTVKWDSTKYPDYNPAPRIDHRQVRQMQQRIATRAAQGSTRPDHWNNALSSAFPSVINQSGGSCGSASRVHYMFTHEMNASRWVSASDERNVYPTHFTWLHTKSYGQTHDKEQIAIHNGIPNIVDYGGLLYSELFGYQEDTNNDFGWMQGYSKWFNAMHNRIVTNANFPYALDTDEGRELVKNYLWNHCGDDTYSTGGVVGVGVASGGTWAAIGSTPTNNALGVTGQYYVKAWGSSIDHALTIVGYDDRIEFDLDDDGTYGDPDKDELGAWIVVNSWGSGWCNNGFIYCPYAEARPTNTTTGYWMPEYYTPRRDYRPLRTIKLLMDYDRRSEIALYVGVASDLSATAPEKETWMRHFQYSGEAKGNDISGTAPEVPMLGRWADGMMHTEPMEFGYDLTDLTSGYADGTPLKYFFRVETRSGSVGSGHIYSAYIVDYTIDREGIATPFAIADGGMSIASAGAKTTITTTATGASLPVPRNLAVEGSTLTWQAPAGSSYPVSAYNIYANGQRTATVGGSLLQAAIDDTNARYTVTATYRINGYDVESQPSGFALGGGMTTNVMANFARGTQFTVPDFTTSTQEAYTIEFWAYPFSVNSACMGIKASSGKFFFKVNASAKIEVGYDGGDYGVSTRSVQANKWQHFAIVVSGTSMKVYLNGTLAVSKTSGYSNSGISGSNALWFGKTEGTTTSYKEVCDAGWYGYFDELHIWNYARTQAEVTVSYRNPMLSPSLYAGLTHCYDLSAGTTNNGTYLTDIAGGHHAQLTTPDLFTQREAAYIQVGEPFYNVTSSAAFSVSNTTPVAGEAVVISSACSPSTTQWAWTVTGADVAESSAPCPVVTFTQAGQQTISLTATNLKGATATKTLKVNVAAASVPEPSFTVPEGTLRAGEHISFINTTPQPEGTSFEWTFEGAQVTAASSVDAGATYDAYGTYTVRLTATNAAGTRSTERQVTISKVAPEAAFNIHNNVALTGEKVYLEDATRFDAAEWTWSLSSSAETYIINGQNTSLTFDSPGVYDVSLIASNELGSTTASRARAIVVCNADGDRGLRFDADDDELVAASPLTAAQARVTIEWWMYAGTQAERCLGMGDSESTLLLTTDATGAMTLHKGGQSVTTPAGFVVTNEWHHYAVTNNSSTITFFRDGVSFHTATLSGNVPAMSQFRIGGTDAPVNGIIDELRVWKMALTATNIFRYCNAPLSTVASSIVLYYDFNQSSGNVADNSASALTGTRNNFGPDGDAWTSSKGIFFLNSKTAQSSNVTSTYLKNYQATFATDGTFVNGTSRFKALATGTTASPWVQENAVTTDGVTTGWHVDANKGSYLTLTTQWDGFAAEVNNLKLYQTVTLPAGVYELTATQGSYEWNPSGKYLAAAAGTGLPDINQLKASALGYAQCGSTCTFIITKDTQVSLGLVSSQSGYTCHTIKSLVLKKKAVTTLEPNNEVGIADATASATATLVARGGLGTISLSVSEPQRVDVYDLAGHTIYSALIDSQATIRVRKGIYVVGPSKVMVR